MPTRKRRLTCQICLHRERERIEALRASGASLESLAKKFRVHKDAVWRHWRDHVAPDLKTNYLAGASTIAALKEKAAEENGSVIDYLGLARSVLVGQLTACAEAGDALRVAMLVGKLVEVLREIGRITGEVDRLGNSITINAAINILNDPQVVKFQEGLLEIARAHPDAGTAIIDLLGRLDVKSSSPMLAAPAPVIDVEPADAA